MRRSTLIAAVLFGFAASGCTQDKVTFGRKYEPGTYVTTYKEKTDTKTSGPKEAKKGLDSNMTVEVIVEKASEREQKLQVIVRRFQLKITGPQEVSYDSAQADEKEKDPTIDWLKQFLDKKIDVTLDDKGAVEAVPTVGSVKVEHIEDLVKSSLGLDFSHLPDKTVAVGDHWDTTVSAKNLKMTSTLRKVETVGSRKVAVVDIEGSGGEADKFEKPAGDDEARRSKFDIKGTVKVDVASGRVLESRIEAMGRSILGSYKGSIETATKEGKYESPKATPKE